MEIKNSYYTLAVLLLVGVNLISLPSFGHSEGEDYIFANFLDTSIEGEFQINFTELEQKLGISIPDDESSALKTISDTAPKVQQYIDQNFSIAPPGQNKFQIEFIKAGIVPETTYAQYLFRIDSGELPDNLVITHQMFYENDPVHRGLFLVQYNAKQNKDYGAEYTALVFSPNNPTQTLDLNNISGLLDSMEMVWQGMLHIWLGIDHVLFILALILPIVLVNKNNQWQPVTEYKSALWQLLKIITVFTLAHSITLLLAALQIIKINSQFVESMIALSIILVALNNITQSVKRGSLWIILFLGLFHGLGFATVMGNLPFRMEDLVKMVIRFNIGVELGQIVIVLLLFPILYLLRRSTFYVPVILKAGSVLLILIASYWFIQRAFA